MTPRLSRRKFLQMLAMLGISATLRPKPLSAQSSSVLVIGAGASGLTAGYWLSEEGYTVKILEARDRVGGRAWSNYDLAPYPIEFGAEFIHGDEVVTWDILEELGQDSLNQAEGQFYIHFDKTLYTEEEFATANDLAASLPLLIVGSAYEWQSENNGDISITKLIDLIDEAYPDLVTAEVKRLLIHSVVNDYGALADDMSLRSLTESYETSGDGDGDFRLENGYSAIWEAIADELDIVFNSPASHIEWSDNGAVVTTQSGDTYEANHVIVTLPLGVLQSNQVNFIPALPQSKRSAIEQLGAGHVDKLIMKFDSPFWQGDMVGVITTLDTRVWWRPGFERDTEEPILTAFFSGESALKFEAMSEEDVISAGLADLEQIFGIENLKERLVEAHFISWGTDPYAKMGYSYIPVGVSGQNSILGEPVAGTLFFAGEATHPNRFATVHGAIESGIRVANEILDL